jgi:hypothetical protein
VPVPGLTNLEASAIQFTLAGKRMLNHCGLPFAFPSTDRNGNDRLFRRGIAGLDDWRTLRQTHVLELAAENETWETPT